MPLSTSSSEERLVRPGYRRPIAVTLTMLVVLFALIEVTAQFGFKRISHIESRTEADHQAALAVRPGGPAKPSILLLGNSLLLEGMDYDAMRRDLEPRATPVRFVVEQTAYLDWYYGIRRLLSDGARPDRIVLCLNLDQLLENNIRGEYSAYFLIRTQDLVSAGRDAGYDRTRISGLFFGRYSMFYAGRNNLRNFALNTVAPGYGEFLHNVTIAKARQLTDAEVLAAAVPRLRKLRALCDQNDILFDFLLPPGFEHGVRGLLDAGKTSGTSVLAPVPQYAWNAKFYRDGFHLNHEGAERFTQVLAATLLHRL